MTSEGAHALETAIAGKAQVLVTANLKDFIHKDTTIVVPQRYVIYIKSNPTVQIVHPYLFMDWIRNGQIPPQSNPEN